MARKNVLIPSSLGSDSLRLLTPEPVAIILRLEAATIASELIVYADV
jgi:hypothetical protein